jgi:signal transduction histidine kinase
MAIHLPKPQRIQTKFITGLLLCALLLGLACSLGFYLHVRNVLEEEVQDKAKLILSQVDSVQHYVRDVLRPTMYERLPSAFVIQAMSSSYISRAIMAPMNERHEGATYRRVAVGARNPEYEAEGNEKELIQYFRDNGRLKLWQGYRMLNGEKYYLMVRPVRFEQECMYCHGQPQDAPAELIKLYGQRGFGKHPGDIAGVDFVGISVHGSVGRVERTIFTYFALFGLVVLLVFFSANVLFKVLVVNNLKRLNSVFRRNINDAEGSALLHKLEQGDEIEELVEGMEQMGEHLFEARSQLQNYAENLRLMVDERTDALRSEVEARRADVHLFVHLLEDMYKSRARAELWRQALPQICTRYGAERIAYLCTMGAQSSFVWPETENLPELPDNFIEVLTGSTCVASANRLFVPVESSTGNAEGLLILLWPSEEEAQRHDRDVLLALGRQLGIAAENLSAIDSLFRQMNILSTIVEGISDPLVLMDGSCTVLTANQAARELTAALTRNERLDGNILSLFFDLQSSECPMRETIGRGGPDLREVSLAGGRSFALALYPVRGRDGSTNQVVVYLRETTMERRMRLQVWQSERMATVGKLTAGLAHEINNPQGVILCYAGLLRQSITDSQQLTDLEIIERHTRQAQRVLQDLLNFSRPKAAGSGIADACAVAASMLEVFSVQAAKKQVAMQLERPEVALFVRLGVGELEQVISNLLINALDAVEPGQGKILVRVGEADMVRVEVEDNGPGVAEEDIPHIYDPFFSTKEIGAGTGLGLTVVYGMVSDVGGRVEVDRSSGLGGARFLICLPKAVGAPEPADHEQGEGEDAASI